LRIEGCDQERRAHVLKTQTAARERHRIGLDAHRRLLRPGDQHQRHAVDLRQLLGDDVVGIVVHRAERKRGG
jgi:hypothetical protein